MSYEATAAQRSYFHSLTGEWLPRGTSKSKASSMIKKAIAGEITRKPDVVRVFGYRLTGTMTQMQERATGIQSPVIYTVEVNRNPGPTFKTLAEAETFARARYTEATIEVSDAVRGVYID